MDCNDGINPDDVKYLQERAMSSLATRRSSSLDTTERFDIGRYERASDGSRSGFFKSGVTYAALYCIVSVLLHL